MKANKSLNLLALVGILGAFPSVAHSQFLKYQDPEEDIANSSSIVEATSRGHYIQKVDPLEMRNVDRGIALRNGQFSVPAAINNGFQNQAKILDQKQIEEISSQIKGKIDKKDWILWSKVLSGKLQQIKICKNGASECISVKGAGNGLYSMKYEPNSYIDDDELKNSMKLEDVTFEYLKTLFFPQRDLLTAANEANDKAFPKKSDDYNAAKWKAKESIFLSRHKMLIAIIPIICYYTYSVTRNLFNFLINSQYLEVSDKSEERNADMYKTAGFWSGVFHGIGSGARKFGTGVFLTGGHIIEGLTGPDDPSGGSILTKTLGFFSKLF